MLFYFLGILRNVFIKKKKAKKNLLYLQNYGTNLEKSAGNCKKCIMDTTAMTWRVKPLSAAQTTHMGGGSSPSCFTSSPALC